MQNGLPIAQKIIEVQRVINEINVHQREHLDSPELNQSCSYCRARAEQVNWINQKNSSSSDDIANATILNELERTVDLSGKKGQVSVPRNWVGRRVKVTLL